MLDRLTAAARHLLILCTPGLLLAGLVVLKAITDAEGVLTAVSWAGVLWAAVAAFAGWLLLVLTPLTRQYGVGANPPVVPRVTPEG